MNNEEIRDYSLSPRFFQSSPERHAFLKANHDTKQYLKFALPKEKEDPSKNELEVVITAWMNEQDLSLKMYDVVTMKRAKDNDDCNQLINETFGFPSDTKSIKVL